jgi:hypothetical protein
VKKDGNIVSYTAEELEQMRARGESKTDWARVDAMTEAELEAAIASDPDWADIPPDWYQHAKPHYPEGMLKAVRLPPRSRPAGLVQAAGARLSGPDQRRAPHLRRGA